MNKSTDFLINLKEQIENLPKENHIEIYKIIKKHTNEYSKNNNGTFVNISILKDDAIEDIQKYLDYIKNQEKLINDIEKQKTKIENTYFNETKSDIHNNKSQTLS